MLFQIPTNLTPSYNHSENVRTGGGPTPVGASAEWDLNSTPSPPKAWTAANLNSGGVIHNLPIKDLVQISTNQ